MAFTLAALDLSLVTALSGGRLPRLSPVNSGPLYMDGWDLGVLAGYKIPGKSKISGGKIKLKHDPKKKGGADGANPTFHGIDPQEFNLDVEVWTDPQLAELVRVCAAVLPQPGSKPPAPQPGQPKPSWPPPVPLYHAMLSNMSSVVTTVVVLGATPFKWGAQGVITMSFELLHWLPAPATKPSQTSTPLRKVENKRAEADAAKRNPAPPTQTGFAAPPGFKTSP